MEQNKQDFSPEQVKRLAQSDVGKRLMGMLGSDTAAQVRRNAQNGNMDEARKSLSQFLSDPKVAALLKQLEEQANG